jgi:hypothetical protein
LTFGEQAVIETALRAWSKVVNTSFREVVDNAAVVGDMRFAYTTDATAHAFFPAASTIAGTLGLAVTWTVLESEAAMHSPPF